VEALATGTRRIQRGHNVKPHLASAFAGAVPFAGRGHRTPQTLLSISERNKLLSEATKFYPGASERETARCLRIALLRYRAGAWRRTRVETQCPPRHRGRLVELLWMILKVRDQVPSERTIRRALAFRGPRPD
jgi:hypothetical protein